MIVDKIRAYLELSELGVDERVRYEVEKLAGVSFSRQFMEEKKYDATGKLWMSSAGKCVRQVAYSYHGFEKNGKELDARAKMIFFYGDLIELMAVYLAKLGGANVTAIGLNQIRAVLKISDEVSLTGRPDGILFDNGTHLIEVKSMSSFAFKRFEAGSIDEGYRVQINANLEALGLHSCVMVGIEKESGAMHEEMVFKDSFIVDSIKRDMNTIVSSTKENLPARPFAPNEKGVYPWQCAYCAFFKTCLVEPGLAERVVIAGGYKLKAIEHEPAI